MFPVRLVVSALDGAPVSPDDGAMTSEPVSVRTASSLRSLFGACAMLLLVLPLLRVVSILGSGGLFVLLAPVVLAGVVLARGWRSLCASRAAAIGHAVVLVLAAVSLGAFTGLVVASAAGLWGTSVDHQIGAVLVGGVVVLVAPSLWLGALGFLDRRRLVAKAAAGR